MARLTGDLMSLARTHTKMGIRVLAQIARDPEQPGSTRVAAIALLFQRGWGNPDNMGAIAANTERIIVEIVQPHRHELEAATIELEPLQSEHQRNGK